MSVRPFAWNNSAPTGRIFMKFDISVFFKNMSTEFKFSWSMTGKVGTLREDRYTFMIISRWIMLEWEMLQSKFVDEMKTHISCSKTIFFSENHAVYEIMWENTVRAGQATDVDIKPRMRFACWITKDTHTHTHTHIHTLRICSTYCFSTATIVARPRLSITLLRTLPTLSPSYSPLCKKLISKGKGKSIPLQARGAQRVPGSQGPQITW